MKKVWVFIFLLVYGVGYSITGNEVLKKVEEVLTKEKDRESLVEVILYSGDKVREKREMQVWNAGKDKRVVKFLSPSSVKGIGVLSLPNSEMYVYLPAYKRVRAIQGSAKDQNFQGTDFSYREIGSFNYSSDFDASIVSEDNENYVLELKRKPNSEITYDRVVMVVSKDSFLPRKLDMFEKGALKKILEITETEKKGNYYILKRLKMTTVSTKTATEIIVKDVKFDQGLELKGIFSQRFLEK